MYISAKRSVYFLGVWMENLSKNDVVEVVQHAERQSLNAHNPPPVVELFPKISLLDNVFETLPAVLVPERRNYHSFPDGIHREADGQGSEQADIGQEESLNFVLSCIFVGVKDAEVDGSGGSHIKQINSHSIENTLISSLAEGLFHLTHYSRISIGFYLIRYQHSEIIERIDQDLDHQSCQSTDTAVHRKEILSQF